jgi:hypothetical protein
MLSVVFLDKPALIQIKGCGSPADYRVAAVGRTCAISLTVNGPSL